MMGRARTEPAFPNLKFDEPLDLTYAPGTDRLFVAERYGKIYSFVNKKDVDKADLALELKPGVDSKGMPLKKLSIFQKPGVTDLRPLQGMELEEIYLTPKNITQGLEILRAMKSLKTIGIDYNQAWPAAEFWERYDKGEFKE